LAVGLVSALVSACLATACEAGPPAATPLPRPGTSAAPREVNVIAKDWVFLPDPVDLVPGETVLIHLINGGLEVHELVIGDGAVQDAWEAAEAAVAGAPPGPTPVVNVPVDRAGIRLVVGSGQRIDLTWTVPPSTEASRLLLGCHIPGHWEKGMKAAIRLVSASG
jgi:uncharacterized cupredoxin-like copper-binding protein